MSDTRLAMHLLGENTMVPNWQLHSSQSFALPCWLLGQKMDSWPTLKNCKPSGVVSISVRALSEAWAVFWIGCCVGRLAPCGLGTFTSSKTPVMPG